LLFRGFHLYRSRRLYNRIQEYKDIVKATTTGTAVFVILGLVIESSFFTSPLFGLFWLFSTALTVLFRTLARYIIGKARIHGRNLRFVIIVGTNKRAYSYARTIEEKKELGYRILGYIDDNIHLPQENINLLGKLKDFSNIIGNHIIDEVILSLPLKSYYKEIQEIFGKAGEQGILVRYIPELFDNMLSRTKIEKFEGHTVVNIISGPGESWQYAVKKGMDFILALIMIITAFPLMVFAAIAIKVTSRGPIFFIQKRIGYNKREFNLYKFRTMVVDAEHLQPALEAMNEMDGPVFKIRDDPRLTRIGRWLRKWSIDELPQLFNVIKGDMSLVGPRPLPIRDYREFSKDWHRKRFSVLPGITCFWQVNGRSNVSFTEWMKMDMKYIDGWKFSLDLKILLKTIPAIIRKEGAV
jgi:exopolysaccharide biosynthesis polyprenyl glycosylphosphotransferase